MGHETSFIQSFLYNQKNVLNETRLFFETLYANQNNDTDFDLKQELKDYEVNKLNDFQNNESEGIYKEVTQTLKNMKNDKSPGCDGFTTNFYKVLWRKIGHFVVRALNFACNSNEFSRNIKLVLITRIPKDNKLDADYVVKWFVQISLWHHSK